MPLINFRGVDEEDGCNVTFQHQGAQRRGPLLGHRNTSQGRRPKCIDTERDKYVSPLSVCLSAPSALTAVLAMSTLPSLSMQP